MTRTLLLCGAVVMLAGCGGEAKHYTLAKSRACLDRVGAGAPAGPKNMYVSPEIASGGVSAVMLDRSKMVEVLFMSSPKGARAYVDRGWPPGVVHTKANAIVWGQQTAVGGPQVSDDELAKVEDCLA